MPHQRRGQDKRRRTFLEELIPENGIRGHFSENPDDAAGDVVGLDVSFVEAAKASVDIWEISMDLLEPASCVKVYVVGLASEEGDHGRGLPGSWRVSHSKLTIRAQSSALSMSATKVGGVGGPRGVG